MEFSYKNFCKINLNSKFKYFYWQNTTHEMFETFINPWHWRVIQFIQQKSPNILRSSVKH